MATTAAARCVSVDDYPEHLNPFREDDVGYGKKKFWTLGRRMSRSSSMSFGGIKDLKNSWALKSFMRKGKKKEQQPPHKIVRKEEKKPVEESSPIVYRRALQSSLGSPGVNSERYVYGGSMTPLPRSRYDDSFHSLSPYNDSISSISPRLARSDVSGSRISADSTNPFEEDLPPIRPARSYRRKKRHAPAPPSCQDFTMSDASTTLQSEIEENVENIENELSIEQMPLSVELKIVEDDEIKEKNELVIDSDHNNSNNLNTREEDILDKVPFAKVDITKYRRNSSLNENEIKLRRGNLEDYHVPSSKRSLSLNASELHYIDDDTRNSNNINYNDNGNHIQRVVCRLYDENTNLEVTNAVPNNHEKLNEIEKATRELEKQISKLNDAFIEDKTNFDHKENDSQLNFHEIKKKFNNGTVASPNPIPKPKRSNCNNQIEKNNNTINTS